MKSIFVFIHHYLNIYITLSVELKLFWLNPPVEELDSPTEYDTKQHLMLRI